MKRVLSIALTGVALLSLFGCPPDPEPAPPPPPPPVKTEPALPDGARLVTDTSGSMLGFLAKGSFALTQLHEEIGGALAPARGTLDFCLVAQDYTCDQGQDNARYSNARTYTGEGSRFDLALDLANERGPTDKRVTVVVTDGIFGGALSGSTGETPEEACRSGASVSCITGRLKALADAGYGVWAVGISFPFNGNVYAERAMDPNQFKKVVASLGPGQQARGFRPSPTAASYQYTGPRPLLVFVVSRDVDLGRKLVPDLVQRFTRLGLADASNPTIMSSEWAPLAPPKARITAVAFQGEKRSPGFLLGQGASTPSGWAQIAECGRGDLAMLHLKIDGATEGRRLVPGEGYRPEVISKIEAAPDGFLVGVECNPLSPGSTSTLSVNLASADPLAGLVAPWWTEWSADDSYSAPSKLFGLAEIARITTASAAAQLPPDDRFAIRITRK